MHSRDGIEALGMLYIIVTVTYLCGVAGCSCRRLCGRIILLCRGFRVRKPVVEVVWYADVWATGRTGDEVGISRLESHCTKSPLDIAPSIMLSTTASRAARCCGRLLGDHRCGLERSAWSWPRDSAPRTPCSPRPVIQRRKYAGSPGGAFSMRWRPPAFCPYSPQ